MQIVLTVTKFVLYVCLLNKLLPTFLFRVNELIDVRRRKKNEHSSECFTHGLGKTIRVFNQVLSKMSWATKLKFLPTILQ